MGFSEYGWSTILSKEEEEFYGDALVLLQGAISEFLSCFQIIRHSILIEKKRDPVATYTARIKSAASMKKKLQKMNLPPDVYYALNNVTDAAGVRLICLFVDDIYRTVDFIRMIDGIEVIKEKDYIKNPKPNGYRSYHMILKMPLRFPKDKKLISLEVQIRTIAMDCWASIEHKLKYKKEIANSAILVQELKRCSDEIISTDLSLQTIRELIEGL